MPNITSLLGGRYLFRLHPASRSVLRPRRYEPGDTSGGALLSIVCHNTRDRGCLRVMSWQRASWTLRRRSVERFKSCSSFRSSRQSRYGRRDSRVLHIGDDSADLTDDFADHSPSRSPKTANQAKTNDGHLLAFCTSFGPMSGQYPRFAPMYSQRRKPPMKAFSLSPRRHFGGRSVRFLAFPPPRTT